MRSCAVTEDEPELMSATITIDYVLIFGSVYQNDDMHFPPEEVIDKLLPESFINIPENRKLFIEWLSTLGIKDDISEDEEELQKYRARLPEFRMVTEDRTSDMERS